MSYTTETDVMASHVKHVYRDSDGERMGQLRTCDTPRGWEAFTTAGAWVAWAPTEGDALDELVKVVGR